FTHRPADGGRLGLIIVFLAAYALVSIPALKTPFLGVIVPVFCMTFYVLACGGIVRSLMQLGNSTRWVVAGFAAALVATSAMVFRWTWAPLQIGDQATATRRHEIIRKLGQFVETDADPHIEGLIFLPVISQFINASTLQFELQKRGLKNLKVSHAIY